MKPGSNPFPYSEALCFWTTKNINSRVTAGFQVRRASSRREGVSVRGGSAPGPLPGYSNRSRVDSRHRTPQVTSRILHSSSSFSTVCNQIHNRVFHPHCPKPPADAGPGCTLHKGSDQGTGDAKPCRDTCFSTLYKGV